MRRFLVSFTALGLAMAIYIQPSLVFGHSATVDECDDFRAGCEWLCNTGWKCYEEQSQCSGGGPDTDCDYLFAGYGCYMPPCGWVTTGMCVSESCDDNLQDCGEPGYENRCHMLPT